MGVQMFVCLSVEMWRAKGNPNPCTDLDKILHVHPHLSKESFGVHLNPTTLPPGPRGSKTLKLKDTLLRCSAGCKLTWAAQGTSASKKYNFPILQKF